MAITERYVTQAAAGGGSGTSGSPWTFAEAITNAVAGDRVNVQSDAAYSIGATTFGVGTIASPIIWRGYDTTIGDCDNLGRSSTGELVTTGMPDITITGNWTMAGHVVLQSLNITGALSGPLIGDTAVDSWFMQLCKVVNTQSNAAASCVHMDDRCGVYMCDFECSGASHTRLVFADTHFESVGCRYKAAAAANCLEIQYGLVERCVFWGSSGATGLYYDAINVSLGTWHALNNTFYGLNTAIKLSNAVPSHVIRVSNNHATDCTRWLDNEGSGSRNVVVIENYNRLRDITTPRTGIESIVSNEINTDTGGHETDYVDATTGDFHLIPAAPGYAAGMWGEDIGAEQHDVPAGGGGLLTHPGMSGGMRG